MDDDDVDAAAVAAVTTHDRLRRLLLHHLSHEPTNQLASALAYELASVIATVAPTKQDAIAVLRAFTKNAAHQIRTFGVGQPHP